MPLVSTHHTTPRQRILSQGVSAIGMFLVVFVFDLGLFFLYDSLLLTFGEPIGSDKLRNRSRSVLKLGTYKPILYEVGFIARRRPSPWRGDGTFLIVLSLS